MGSSWLFGLVLLAGCPSTPVKPTPVTEGPDGPIVSTPEPARVESTLVLVNHGAGCSSGHHGALVFREGGTVLAEVAPGDRAEVRILSGMHTITIDDGGALTEHKIVVAPEGSLLAQNCPVDRFRGQALQPLTLVGPAPTCPAGTTIRARAGGLLLELSVGQRYTLFLPRGSHVVRILGASGMKATREATVDLQAGGAEVQLEPCAATRR